MIFITKNRKHRNIRRGFTLSELLVTISVFTMLSTIVMANLRSVDNSLVLRNVVTQVATVVRKAQIQGISVKGIDKGSGEIFRSYGVNFRTADNAGFTLFVDLNENGVCDPLVTCSMDGEGVVRYSLPRGYTIAPNGLCFNQKSGGGNCNLNRLDITFSRPNPDAKFKENSGPFPGWSDVEVKIQSKNGTVKTVVVWRTGQISIE